MELRLNVVKYLFLLLIHVAEKSIVLGHTVTFPEGCNTSLSLTLRDELFTASSYYSEDHTPSASKPDRDGWAASRWDTEQYLQLDFETPVEITGLRLSRINNGWRSTAVRLTYSLDGLVWTAYNSRLSNEILGERFQETSSSSFDRLVSPSIKARYIAINPTSFSRGRPSMRLEVFGCDITGATSTTLNTQVTGNIEGDAVWIPTQSPMVIDRPITIELGSSLTIQAGVSVVFTTTEAGISVNGNLTTKSLSGLNVLFTSSYPVLSVGGRWNGIKQEWSGTTSLDGATLRQASAGVSGNGKRLRLESCLIHSCTYGVQLNSGTTAVDLTGPENLSSLVPVLNNTVALFNIVNVMLHGTTNNPFFAIQNCKLSDSDYGIRILNWDAPSDKLDTTVLVYKSEVVYHKYTAVYVEIEADMFVLNSNISENNDGIKSNSYSRSPHTLVVGASSFIGNNRAIYVYCHHCSNATYVIQNNSFVSSYVYAYHTAMYNYRIFIARMIVSNNSFTSSSTYVLNIKLESSDYITILANTFNSTEGAIQLSRLYSGDETFVTISDNNFVNVYKNSVLDAKVTKTSIYFANNNVFNTSSYYMLNVESGTVTLIGNNFTSNHQVVCNLNVGLAYDRTSTLLADQNYWGTANVTEIRAKICDFFLDSSKFRVTVDSIYNSSDMTSLIQTASFNEFSTYYDPAVKAYIGGGIITTDTDLDMSRFSDPILINRSIEIMENVSVSLSGLQFNFTDNRGLAVHGHLQIGTLYGNATVLQAHNQPGRWNGIQLFTHDQELSVASLFIRNGFDKGCSVDNRDLIIRNADISGSKVLIDARTAFNVTIEHSSVHETVSLLTALEHTGDVYVNIDSSNIAVRDILLHVSLEDTVESNITNIVLTNSTLTSHHANVLYFRHCISHLNFEVNNCTLSAGSWVIDSFYNADIKIYNNQFVNYDRGIQVRSCGINNPKTWSEGKIEIHGNLFSGSGTNPDIYIYYYMYINKISRHEFYITNNTFIDNLSRRKAIETYQPMFSPSIYIKNNIFKLFATGVKLYGVFDEVLIEHNVFEDGKCFVYADFRYYTFKNFSIKDNVVRNNDNDNVGIIQLLQSITETSSIIYITDNLFFNNSGDVVRFTSPAVAFTHNFFESEDVDYNLQVSKVSTSFENKYVNASLNYWGTDDPWVITNSIFDHDYDETLLDVIFRPYLASRNISDVQNKRVAFIRGSEIGGAVNGDAVLTTDASPYRVVSNIKVQETDSLTIEEGVQINVEENYGIFVLGVLNVTGTETMPVFLGSQIPGKPWKGIDLSGNLTSWLQHIIINDTLEGLSIRGYGVLTNNITSTFSANNGITIEIQNIPPEKYEFIYSGLFASESGKSGIVVDLLDRDINETTILIDGCAANDNKEHGVLIKANASVELRRCSVNSNDRKGFYIYQTNGGSVNVSLSSINRNVESAIWIQSTFGFTLTSSSISNHVYRRWQTDYTIYYMYYSSRGTWEEHFNVTIGNNTFENNTINGIRWTNRQRTNFVVHNNTFTGGRNILHFEPYSSYNNNYWNISFYGNIVKNNSYLQTYTDSAFTDGALVDLDASYGYIIISIENNAFMHNKGTTGIQLSSPVSSKTIVHDVLVQDNVFSNNTVSEAFLNIQNYPRMKIQHNVFMNYGDDESPVRSQTCELKSPEFLNSTFNLNATFNYWGTRRVDEVVNKVCGFDKNMRRSYIYYMPYYISDGLNRLETLEHDMFDIDGATGGEIRGDVTLSDTTFTGESIIGRSIMIRNGSTLSVAPGTQLAFEHGRGIYVDGRLILQGESRAVNLTNTLSAENTWYGIILNSASDISVISNTSIINTEQGVIANTPTFEMRNSWILNVSSNCLTMQLGSSRIVDFQGTILQDCSKDGIALSGTGDLTIVNVVVENARRGIDSSSEYGNLVIRSSSVRNCSDSGMSIWFTSSSNVGNVSIENCVIEQSPKGIDVRVYNYMEDTDIKITRNNISNISQNALNMQFPLYWSYYRALRNADIAYNTFNNACLITLTSVNYAHISFHDNLIYNSSCVDVKSDVFYLDIFSDGNYDIPDRVFDVSSNVFNNISSTYLIRLRGTNQFDGRLNFNHFLDNKASKGVLLVDTKYLSMTENIFDSPLSLFDVYVEYEGSDVINASNNWWGSPDMDEVQSRIYDGRQNYRLLTLNVTPILTERTVDCFGVNNCSSHGECISRDRCSCHAGWSGTTCDNIDCSGLNYCYGNGKCVGLNVCQCSSGWSGDLCIVASCENVNDCNGHGICVRPDVCTCANRFTGSDCGSCEDLHWGSLCQPCPACLNGNCDLETGGCSCHSHNWGGQLCDQCSETYYGPGCLPLMMALSIIPNEGLDTGGNQVHVWGHNFPNTTGDSYTCKFGNVVVNGTWLAWNHVTCPAPTHAEEVVYVEISPNGTTYTDNKLTYSFYPTCPPGSCGRDITPPRGQCLFGGCSCILPWAGDNCETELLASIITTPPQQVNVSESSYYTYQLQLEQGERPIRWTLLSGPQHMVNNERTATVEWEYALARAAAYTVRVEARNRIGSHVVEWNILVLISYSAEVVSITPSGDLSVPKTIVISVDVTFEDASAARVVPVDVEVSNGGRVVKHFQVFSDPMSSGPFSVTYYPRPDDAGEFTVTARHPSADPNESTQLSWRVKGMRCSPVYITWHGIIEGNVAVYENVSTLINTGGLVINHISAQVDGLPGAYVRKAGSASPSDPFLGQLSADGAQHFDLVVNDPRPLSGTIYLVFTSREGLTTRLRVNIKLSIKKPQLYFSPSSIRENVNRGSQKIIDIQVENRGDVSARNVLANLPNDHRLSLVAFSYVNENRTSSNDEQAGELTIPPQGIAKMTIAVIIDPSESLGEMSGQIAVNTNLTYAYISYNIFITTLETLTLSISVTDEYSYFASDRPKVAGATVKLHNQRRGYNEIRYTANDTDAVVFEDIYEDRYTLYVEAEDHSSYSAVIIAAQDKTTHEAFLKRTAVNYDWTVTPTTVEDVYIISLESTFETSVPMPVITIEPAKVNTLPYELEQKDTIEFTIANHGLIRADNVRLALPTSHPYLEFESNISSIGHLDANTTIGVPVKTKVKSRPKRNAAAAAICGLVLLYDLQCGGTQSYSRDVTLTREVPGRPPLPCGLGGGGDGLGGGGDGCGGCGGRGGVGYTGGVTGSGNGSVVAYNPVTPLSCDCAKTLIKSCALAYIPIVGCVISMADLGLTDKRTMGSDILGTLKFITGLLDTTFSCVIGVIYKLLGLIYTTIRCLIDVALNCGDSRRRRDVSSDVVQNMLNVARPMDNFVNMMEEIFGDPNIYNIESLWYGSFKTAVADDSESGSRLSGAEVSIILNVLQEEAQKETLTKFLHRWNNTAAAWENGTLNEMTDSVNVINLSKLGPNIEQYLNDIDAAKDKGYNSIFDEFDNAVGAYNTAEQESKKSGAKDDNSVCAKVRVKIVQELVLTRDAFNARLEIENGENSDLEDIRVEIRIRKTYGTGELANDDFSIGSPTLIGITGVDGKGRLGQDLSGTAEWLIIPYSSAAPREDTLYDFGGRLSYRVGGSELSVPLLPATLTVKSNPNLVVHYFHEKYVRGDDPMTTEIEPIVPFSLCVMIMNAGYGVANALKISSAQPEIIENEKGLLISFKIIGAQLGNDPLAQSLTVKFGDIHSFETKTARWLLTSTLKGTFSNYSATFENINPLGDPQLSLLDELGYHELIHLVRIESSDDELDDFLVNDIVDDKELPDKLYNSANGSDVHNVSIANVTDISVSTFVRSGTKKYTVIHLNNTVESSSNWHYIRTENNITSPSPQDNEYLLQAIRQPDKELLVDKNVWQTTHILDTFFIHVFDSSDDFQNNETTHVYTLTYGQRNMYPPKFNSTSYSGTVTASAPEGSYVLILDAYDIDKDAMMFKMANDEYNVFKVDPESGAIYLNNTVSIGQRHEFSVAVFDQGIPSKSSTVMVSITVTDDANNTSTTTMTSSLPSATTTTSTNYSTTVTVTNSTPAPTTTASIATNSTVKSSLFTSSTTPKPTYTTNNSSSMPSTTPNNSISSSTSKSTSSVSSSSVPPISSSTTNGTAGEQEGDFPRWVIPTAIGATVVLLIIVVIVVFLFVYMRQRGDITVG